MGSMTDAQWVYCAALSKLLQPTKKGLDVFHTSEQKNVDMKTTSSNISEIETADTELQVHFKNKHNR